MTCRIFQDDHGDWRWTLIATNGRTLACSGEGYKHRRHCVRILAKLFPRVMPT